MSRQGVDRDALENVKVRVVERLPIQFIEAHVMAHIRAKMGLCGDCPAGMLELLFMGIDGDINADEMLQTTCMIQMKAQDHCFHVLDIVSSDRCCRW